jgi:hypothetical protein
VTLAIVAGDLLCFRHIPINSPPWYLLEPRGAIVPAMGFTGLVFFSLAVQLLIYLYAKLNDAKLSKVPPEVKAQAPSNFSLENIRSTAIRLIESPLQINNRLPPRTGRRYIVVGGVSGEFVLLRIMHH